MPRFFAFAWVSVLGLGLLLPPPNAKAQEAAESEILVIDGGAEWNATPGPWALFGVTYRGVDSSPMTRLFQIRTLVGVGAGENGLGVEYLDLEIRPFSRALSDLDPLEKPWFDFLPITVERDFALDLDRSVTVRLLGMSVTKESERAFASLAVDAMGIRAFAALEEMSRTGLYAYGADAALGGKFSLGGLTAVRLTYVGGKIDVGQIVTGRVYSRAAFEFHRFVRGYVEGGWRFADYAAFRDKLPDDERRLLRRSTADFRIGIEARLR